MKTISEKLNGKWNIHCLLRGPEASMETWRAGVRTFAEVPEIPCLVNP